ncbi:hypothetical protein BLNAU_14767 [Blattamonas nauphoetae]|uniref:Uncharacterized protein n=1 Tax=Blattamonas nauphoetae TaxID=2049346 RepID=A0ABQ9XJD4_9EUKA|nr:hypothetical protein BLNAU_14767 [Blattamonas nauphoetae]
MKRILVSERLSRRTSQLSQLSTRSRTSINPSSLRANPFFTLLVLATSTITAFSSSSTRSVESFSQLDRAVLVPPFSPLPHSRSLRGLPPTSPVQYVSTAEELGESAASHFLSSSPSLSRLRQIVGCPVFPARLCPLPLHRRHQSLQHPTIPSHLITLPLPPLLLQPSELSTNLFSVHKQSDLARLFHLHPRLQPPHPTLLHSHLLRGLSPSPLPLLHSHIQHPFSPSPFLLSFSISSSPTSLFTFPLSNTQIPRRSLPAPPPPIHPSHSPPPLLPIRLTRRSVVNDVRTAPTPLPPTPPTRSTQQTAADATPATESQPSPQQASAPDRLLRSPQLFPTHPPSFLRPTPLKHSVVELTHKHQQRPQAPSAPFQRLGPLRRHSRLRTADDHPATLPLRSSARPPTLLPC